MSVRRQILCGGMAVLLGLAAANAQAELLVYETFSVGSGGYTAGLIDANTAPATLGLTGDWTTTGGNIYVGQDENGTPIGNQVAYDRPNAEATKSSTVRSGGLQTVYNATGDTFYASYILEPADVTGVMSVRLNFAKVTDDTDGRGINFGIAGGQYFYERAGDSATSLYGGTVTAERQLLVVKVEYNNGTVANAERVTLWVNPTSETDSSVLSSTNLNLLNNGGGKLSAVELIASGMAGQPAYFDDLRLSTTFDEVVPEPSTWAMVLIGLVVCLGINPTARARAASLLTSRALLPAALFAALIGLTAPATVHAELLVNLVENGDFEDTTGWGAVNTPDAPAGWTYTVANPAGQQSGATAIGGSGTSAYMAYEPTTTDRRMEQMFGATSNGYWNFDVDFASNDPGAADNRSLHIYLTHGTSFGGSYLMLRVNGDGDIDVYGRDYASTNTTNTWYSVLSEVVQFSDVDAAPAVHHLQIVGHYDQATPSYDVILTDSNSTTHSALGTQVWRDNAPGTSGTASGVNGIQFSTHLSGGDYLIDNVSLSQVPEPSTWAMVVMAATTCLGIIRRRQIRV